MLASRALAIGLMAASLGCTGLGTKTQTVRPQSNDDPNEKLASVRVGDKTVVDNIEAIPVSAVGLVWKLNGTGSAASGEWRAMLERDLRKKKLPNISQYLDDPTKSTSLVLVSAVIPPGSKKGDTIDIDVTLPRANMWLARLRSTRSRFRAVGLLRRHCSKPPQRRGCPG